MMREPRTSVVKSVSGCLSLLRRTTDREQGLSARTALLLAVFAYLVVVRTWNISRTFWLLGDQILYWRIALGSWRELPIGGGPTSVGGTTLGPIFVWILWAIRHIVGPWTDNLPHAGGIGISIVQSAADVYLMAAIWKKAASWALALAVTLFVGTSPYDMALTATIWNPPVAEALVKISIATVLGDTFDSSVWRGVTATATSLLAAQTHSSAVFVAAPVIVSFTVRDLIARRWGGALRHALCSAAVILVLESPLLLHSMTHPEQTVRPDLVVNSVAYTIAHPAALRPAASFGALGAACAFILLRPWAFAWFGAVLAAGAGLTAFRARRDLLLACVTVAPLLCAGVAFSFWQLPFDHYWFLTIAPSAALTLAFALTAWAPARLVVAAALAVAAVLMQPARIADGMTIHRLPEYGPLARGSRTIRQRTAEVRGIETQFALPPSTDRGFLYGVLGGRIGPDSQFTAIIGSEGQVSFRPVGP
jgi:hypothetical protein